MSHIQSFDCVAAPDARILILGSIPGVKSLQEVQYYAHPRNSFWPIMAQLLDFAPALPYAERLDHLKRAGIALWDVVHRCHRPGSLDQNIAGDSVEANDFATFFREHPQVRAVFFNGGTAETLFKRHVIRGGTPLPATLRMNRLPSTSPANAGLRLEQKLEHWRVILK
ncbi:DNA-deoxyinosine glycosylase [Marinobacterium sedimentorum]|uniref:DNA-deoxyinosine glycosylase n=1 Tax=Marinobacterium sedimentorum TaxID=2927804 RepID=UPI0020C5E08A|nr:DNA-deoxyinosine glycosylase [Marinobacterium sedimentorum]MCP8687882.1 DNA-deoxyinosine glycosylase [Marinobacterium sedimentorum]